METLTGSLTHLCLRKKNWRRTKVWRVQLIDAPLFLPSSLKDDGRLLEGDNMSTKRQYSFSRAFSTIKNYENFILLWQKQDDYGFNHNYIANVEKDFKNLSSVTLFSTLHCTPPSPEHRLQLWLKYLSFTEGESRVCSAKPYCCAVTNPTNKEIAEYRRWELCKDRVEKRGKE